MNGLGTTLLVLSIGAPLTLALLSLCLRRPRLLLPWGAAPSLIASLVSQGAEANLDFVLLGAAMRLDLLGAIFLGFGSFVWLCAGAFAIGYLADARERSFCAFWQMTLAGVAGVFVAADVALFYVSFAVLSLAAFVLVAHERTPAADRAARMYIVLALLGETSLLIGLIIGSAGAESIAIPDVRAALAASPWRDEAVLALLFGFGLKAGLLPVHVWLPLAHSAAPAPASAVLSGVIVKAGIVGLIRFLPANDALPAWSVIIIWLGLATTYYGAIAGLMQSNPKAVLAYSTMSQMGLLVAVIGAGMASAGAAGVHAAAALYATHHGLAKAALFLSVGVIATSGGAYRRVALALAALLGAAIAGLPFTGGALAKLAIKAPMGYGAAATVASLSAVGTMLLMIRYIALVARTDTHERDGATHFILFAPFLALTAAAFILPWFLVASIPGEAAAATTSIAAIWAAGWPILAALLIASAFWSLRLPLPEAPVGDIVTLAERIVHAIRSTTERRLPWSSSPARIRLRPPHVPASDVFVRWAVSTTALAASAITFVLLLLLTDR